MEVSQIQQLIESGLSGVDVTVTGDGYHYEAIVVGDCFEGKSMVEQQKMVYATLNEHITSGAIHAVTIKTYTPEQWKKASQFKIGSE
ncbi:MAG: BolA family transcriptional regulator [Gammaproteobacteria bacterium]|jgi:acid stress-induced BolA-like protein IbaG/YrbA